MTTFYLKTQNTAKPTHLAASQIVLRMVLQPGIHYGLRGRLAEKKVSDLAGVLAVSLHANVQSFDTAQHQPAVHGARHATAHALLVADSIA